MAQGEKVRISRFRVERAARMHRTNTDAARSLGIAPATFVRLCTRHEIETPYARYKRRHRERSHEGSTESDE